MKKDTCPHFNRPGPATCSAPLCPLEEQENRSSRLQWYPDEEICRLTAAKKGKRWVKIQKRIAARIKHRNFYFTQKMLENTYVVRSGTKGVSPDGPAPRRAEDVYCEARTNVEEAIKGAKERGGRAKRYLRRTL